MLQAIVGNNHVYVGPVAQQRLCRLDAHGVDGHRRTSVGGNQGRLVTKLCRGKSTVAGACVWPNIHPIATADHTRCPAALGQLPDQFNDHGRFARAADVNIPDNDDRYRGEPYALRVPTVSFALAPYEEPGQPGQGQQQCTDNAAAGPDALRYGGQKCIHFHCALWVAKLSRSMPARRAASITRMTESCVAWASALMTSAVSGLRAVA